MATDRNSLRPNPRKAWLRTAKANAKRDGMEFSIELEDLPPVPDVCPILGMALSLDSENKDFVPSLGRIDNSKGFVKGNVVIESRRANRLRSDATPEELRKLAASYGPLELRKWIEQYIDTDPRSALKLLSEMQAEAMIALVRKEN